MMDPQNESVFHSNMELLKRNHRSVWETVSKGSGVQPRAEIIFSENGKANLCIKRARGTRLLIHDEQDPGSEAISFVNNIAQDFHGTILVFGMGLGHCVRALLNKECDFQYLIIFELDIDFFELALATLDHEKLLTDERVIISVGEVDDVNAVLQRAKRALMLEDIHTHKLLSCFRVNQQYETLASEVFNQVSAFNIDGTTRSFYGDLFIENRLKHLTSMHHDQLLEELTDKYKGRPALIVAAGPSLDKNIDQIHNAVGKAVIIAVDTALPVLIEHGITPDFVTSIDFNAPIYEKIAGVASLPIAREIKLICTSWVACTVTKIFPAKFIFWAFGNNPFENWMKNIVGGRLNISGAGTVAHLNYVAADVMGCDPLIFVGQDLAHSYDREHASGVVLTGTETMEKVLKDAVWVKGVQTQTVPTTRSLHGYRVLFEQWIPETDAKVINATEGGAWIEGAEHMSLTQAVDTFCRSEFTVEPQNLGDRSRKTIAPMDAMLKRVIKAEKLVKKAERLGRSLIKEIGQLHLYRKNFFSLSSLPNKLRQKVIELDGCHNKADQDTLWEIFDEMTMQGLKYDERKKREIKLLEGIPERYLEWLLKNIERMHRVTEIRKENLEKFKKQLTELISFHSTERKLLNQIEKEDAPPSSLLALLKLYYDNGDYTLLSNMLDLHACDRYKDAAILFYYGIIALHRERYDSGNRYLEQCCKMDSSYRQKILAKRREMADFYYEWAQTLPLKSLHNLEDQSGVYARMKGLKMYPTHEGICIDFKELAARELTRINSEVEKDGVSVLLKNEECLGTWIDFFEKDQAAAMGFEIPMIISFYRFYGKVYLDTDRYEEALALFRKAIDRFSGRPELFISAADICFCIKDFGQGVEYLKKAVALDKNYAVYWQNMGDNMVSQGKFREALQAYTEAADALPKRTDFWKRIGDCHMKLGNEDAAWEAYCRHQPTAE